MKRTANFTAFLLLLCLLWSAIWIRSYWAIYSGYFGRANQFLLIGSSDAGTFTLQIVTPWPANDRAWITSDSGGGGSKDTPGEVERERNTQPTFMRGGRAHRWDHLGIHYEYSPVQLLHGPDKQPCGMDGYWASSKGAKGYSYDGQRPSIFRGIETRHSVVLAALGSLLLLHLSFKGMKAWRKRSRESRSLCTVCGYDLRASPLRCPECGTPTPAVVAALSPKQL